MLGGRDYDVEVEGVGAESQLSEAEDFSRLGGGLSHVD